MSKSPKRTEQVFCAIGEDGKPRRDVTEIEVDALRTVLYRLRPRLWAGAGRDDHEKPKERVDAVESAAQEIEEMVHSWK